MIGAESSLFGSVISAVNGWRSTATSAGIQLTQVNVVMPDGRPMSLHWSSTDNDWVVETHE